MCCLFRKDKKREERGGSSPKVAYPFSEKSLKKIIGLSVEENNDN